MKNLRMKGQASTPSKLLKGYAYGGRVARADGGRVSKLTQGYAAGGMIGDELSEDMGLWGFDHGEPDGDEAMPRLDKPMRGKGNTTVNVIVSAPAKPEAPPMPPPMPMMAPKPPMPPMGPPPGPGGPPGGNMGMPPPPPLPGIRKSGGRVGYKDGGAVKHPGKDRVSHIMRRNGGKVIDAGSASGVGRLEKYAAGGSIKPIEEMQSDDAIRQRITKRAAGGKVNLDAGSGSGIGRLEKSNLPIPKTK